MNTVVVLTDDEGDEGNGTANAMKAKQVGREMRAMKAMTYAAAPRPRPRGSVALFCIRETKAMKAMTAAAARRPRPHGPVAVFLPGPSSLGRW